MSTYVLNITLIFLWAVLLLWQRPSRRKTGVFCVLGSAHFILLAGLRHVSVGPDTYAYKIYSFDIVPAVPWSELIARLSMSVLGQSSAKDPGYPLLVKGFQIFSLDYQVFLVFIALLFMVPLGLFVYRYSHEPFVSFLIYACLFYNVFPETATRQSIALSLVVLIGYRLIERRHLFHFVLLLLVAVAIHKSAIVFLPFYFIATQRVTRSRVFAAFALAAVVYVLRAPLTVFFGNFLGYEEYTVQFSGAGATVFSGMLVLVIVIALWRAPVILGDDPHATEWYNATLVALVLTPLIFVHPVVMRVVQYYSIFLLLLIPAVLRSFRDKNERILAYLVVVSLLLFLFFRVDSQYLFFWQGA